MKLSLSGGRRITLGIKFTMPDREHVQMAFGEEADAQAAIMASEAGLMPTPENIDKMKGVALTPYASLSVHDADERIETEVHMSKEELLQHIYAARAVYESMDKAGREADKTWAKYREKLSGSS